MLLAVMLSRMMDLGLKNHGNPEVFSRKKNDGISWF
jgi:hypothetical protein